MRPCCMPPQVLVADTDGLDRSVSRAEVGRASWLLLHTMASRLPEIPTATERDAFSSFLLLFAINYPCGECAQHFQDLLHLYPPYPQARRLFLQPLPTSCPWPLLCLSSMTNVEVLQTSTRSDATLHMCKLHNLVNVRLKKPEKDCSTIDEEYDCGCGLQPPVKRDPLTGFEMVGG